MLTSTHSAELFSPQTVTNLAAILIAPVNAYQSVLTLLAIPHYVPLLTPQPFNTRRTLAHAVIASILKNETIIDSPEDVNGILDLCHVLVKDQNEPRSLNNATSSGVSDRRASHQASLPSTYDELAEEQGWVARMIHLFKSEDLDTHYEVCWSCRFNLHNMTSTISYYKLLGDSLIREGTAYGLPSHPWQLLLLSWRGAGSLRAKQIQIGRLK